MTGKLKSPEGFEKDVNPGDLIRIVEKSIWPSCNLEHVGFLVDKINLGETIRFSLTATYPRRSKDPWPCYDTCDIQGYEILRRARRDSA